MRILFAEERPSAVAGEEAPAIDGRHTVRIAVAGDTGTGDEAQRATVRRIVEDGRGDPHDALLLLGDLIYDDGDADLTDELVTDAFAPVTDAGAELIPVLGNHDYESGEEDEIFEPGRPDRWYVDRVEPVRVVVLDSNEVDDEQQTDWLRGAPGGTAAERDVDDRGHAPPRVLRRGARLGHGGPRGVEPAVRGVRRAAGAGGPRPRLPALPAPRTA